MWHIQPVNLQVIGPLPPNLLEILYLFYALLHNHGLHQRMRQEKIMWVLELNVAGYRFTREVPDLPRTSLRSVRFRPRSMHWRIPQSRQDAA